MCRRQWKALLDSSKQEREWNEVVSILRGRIGTQSSHYDVHKLFMGPP